MNQLPYIIGAGIFIAVIFITYGLMVERGDFRKNRLVTRLRSGDSSETHEQYISSGQAMPWQRLAAPAVDIIKQYLGAKFSQGGLQATEKLLVAANRPFGLTAVDFHALKILGAGVLGVVGFLYSALLGEFGFGQLPLTVLGFTGGYILPDFYLKKILKKRRDAITCEIINVLDLLCLAVTHGVDEKVALRTISEKGYGILAEEIGIVVKDMNMRGVSMTDAFRDMSFRCDTPEVHDLYNNVIRLTQLYGTPMKDVLGGISEKVRHQVYQRTNEMAETAKVKMYLPIGFCNVPAMLIILLGPSLLSMYKYF